MVPVADSRCNANGEMQPTQKVAKWPPDADPHLYSVTAAHAAARCRLPTVDALTQNSPAMICAIQSLPLSLTALLGLFAEVTSPSRPGRVLGMTTMISRRVMSEIFFTMFFISIAVISFALSAFCKSKSSVQLYVDTHRAFQFILTGGESPLTRAVCCCDTGLQCKAVFLTTGCKLEDTRAISVVCHYNSHSTVLLRYTQS